MTADRLMVLGTGSGVGKSVVTAGLGRLFHRRGRSVAPFKAQNMSNNSRVAVEGGEIAASQAYQARACGVAPSVDFNPLLLKPTSDHRSELLVRGRPVDVMDWDTYRDRHAVNRRRVLESFGRVESRYDLVLMEGAGSPAEPNLMSHDLVNLPLAREVEAPAVLVGDISAGGVFAWLTGTLELLSPEDRDRIKGFVINKFRGTRDLLEEAIHQLEARTGKPVLGVLPHRGNLMIPAEDSLELDGLSTHASREDALRVHVVGFPHVSNFTDLEPLAAEPDVELRVINRSGHGETPDLVVLPGTKNTLEDLAWMHREGWLDRLRELRARGVAVLGLCGGYQMMGQGVRDPEGLESDRGKVQGLGWFDFEVRFRRPKITRRVHAEAMSAGASVTGYEIRYGRLRNYSPKRPWLRDRSGDRILGVRTEAVWGTTLHGLFESPDFRRRYVNHLRRRKGLKPLDRTEEASDPYDRWADVLEEHLDPSVLPVGSPTERTGARSRPS